MKYWANVNIDGDNSTREVVLVADHEALAAELEKSRFDRDTCDYHILKQDRRVMESAQLNYLAEGDDFERSVEADAPTLLARRVIRMARAGRWPAEKDTLKFREQLTIRS